MQATQTPLTDREIEELDGLLAALPAPLEPLDVTALDGYLCGVLLQPRAVAAEHWLPLMADMDGRSAPAGAALERMAALAQRRHSELERAIAHREWFDPWVFELEDEASPAQAVLPWVAGFSHAMEHFPALLALDEAALLEPLAVLYAAFERDDLEDADEELLAMIDTLEPPADMAQAVEDLVRSVLLIADISRPRRPAPARAARGSKGRPRR
jgi:uncharacterized protein